MPPIQAWVYNGYATMPLTSTLWQHESFNYRPPAGLARSVKVIGLEVVKMEKIVDGVPHINIEEAAGELATTPLRILMLIREGVMKGRQLEEEWYVDKNSMACFRAYGADQDKLKGCKGSCASGGCSGLN